MTPSHVLSIAFICLVMSTTQATAQPADSARVDRSISRLPEGHSPDGALWRSLAVPGWGQIYNRQYWKLPLVYGGLGGVAFLAIRLNSQHKLYTRAFQWKAWEEQLAGGEPDSNPFPEFEDEYRQVVAERGSGGDINSSQLKPIRDNFKRNRDLSLFGIGLVYGLSTLDAFVSAHLLDFDVGEDLTVQVLPYPDGVMASLRISL